MGLIVTLAGVCSASRPEWVNTCPSDDSEYLYAVGQAERQLSEETARQAALKDASKQFVSRLQAKAGYGVSLQNIAILHVEEAPDGFYVEDTTAGTDGWILARWPFTELDKAVERARGSGSERSDPPAGGGPKVAMAVAPDESGGPASQPSSTRTSAAADKTITYSGKAEADGRSVSLTLTFQGNTLSGRLQAQGVSSPGIRLPSTDISFKDTPFSGAWESPDNIIAADWTGGDYADGKLMPDYPTQGRLTIRLTKRDGKEVVFLHRVASSKYGYVFTPQGSVYDSGGTNPPGTSNGDPLGAWECQWQPPQAGNSGGDKNALFYIMTFASSGLVRLEIRGAKSGEPFTLEGRWSAVKTGVLIKWIGDSKGQLKMDDSDEIKARFDGPDCLVFDTQDGAISFTRKGAVKSGKKPVTKPKNPPDKDEIEAIALEPDQFKMQTESVRDLPDAIAILKKTLERVPLDPDDLNWRLDTGGKIESGRIVLGKTAKVGDSLILSAELKEAPKPIKAKARIQVVEELKLGSVSVGVTIDYTPSLTGQSGVPRAPNSATLELRPSYGPNKTVRTMSYRPGSRVIFKDVEPGQYNVWITAIDLPALPPGYVPEREPPVQCRGWTKIPEERSTDEGRQLVYDQSASAEFRVRIPKQDPKQSTAGFVYGRILYKGDPVPKATINVILPPYTKHLYYSNAKGEYSIETGKLDSGEYRITVEKFIRPRIASPGDYLDVENTKNQKPIIFNVPLNDFNGKSLDIDTLTRAEIFGSSETLDPADLP